MHKRIAIIAGIGLSLCGRFVYSQPAETTKAATQTVERSGDPLALSNLLQLTLGMLVVLGVIIGIAWLLKRSGRFQIAAGGGLKILGGLSMGTRERVVLVQVGDDQLLLGVTQNSINTLHVLDSPLSVSSNVAVSGQGFAQQLGSLLSAAKKEGKT